MRVVMSWQRRRGLKRGLVVLAVLVTLLPGCMTESARQSATSAAGGSTPEMTMTPSGDILMIGDEVVVDIFIPDPTQPPLYALTGQRLYNWRNREWRPTPTLNDGRMFLVDPNNPDRLFRGNHPPCAQTPGTTVIDFEVSEDRGETWQTLPNGRNVRPLAIDPVFPNVIYGTDCSLRISSDLGNEWRYFQPLYQHEIVDLVVVGERLLVLGVSTQGKSQIRELRMTTPARPQLSDIIIEALGVATVDADDTRIVVGARDGVHLSLDGGQTWSSTRIGLESVTVAPDDVVTPATAVPRPNRRFGVLTIEIDPANKHRIFAGTVRGLYISQDDGGTWDRYRAIDETARVLDIQFTAGGADVYVTTDSGVIAVPNP